MATRTDAPISLESGDHLTREEFHRRYSARPDILKAELVDGVVYVASPVRVDFHGRPHGFVMLWLGAYAVHTPGVECVDNATVFLGDRGEVQPDAFLWRPASAVPRMNENGYLEGPPPLVVEVAASSASYDLHEKVLHEKKESYRRNGVREYVVWRVHDAAINWFRLRDGQYVPLERDADGIIASEEFPGLRLHVTSMLAGDMATVLDSLKGAG